VRHQLCKVSLAEPFLRSLRTVGHLSYAGKTGLMDYERAIAAVDEVLGLLDQTRPIYEANTETYVQHPQWRRLQSELWARLPLVSRIAAQEYPDAVESLHDRGVIYAWPWTNCYEACVRLRGALSTAGDASAILGPHGPRLSADALHPWVWHAAVDLWPGKHYRQAVQDAYTRVESLAQSKLGRHDVSGHKFWGQAFTVQGGGTRLRFKSIAPNSEAFNAAHEGAMHFGMGCAQGIRNWAAHSVEQLAEQTALEHLAALSVLARWVDHADVAVVP
jgi:hypothetical protein